MVNRNRVSRLFVLVCGILCCSEAVRGAPVTQQQAAQAANTFITRTYPVSNLTMAKTVTAAGQSARTVQAVRPLVEAGQTIGYVADLDSTGYVLLSSDDEAPPVKCYTDAGSFDQLPPGFLTVLKLELAEDLSVLAGMNQAASATNQTSGAINLPFGTMNMTSGAVSLVTGTASYKAQWQALLDPASQPKTANLVTSATAGSILLTSTWHQNDPYNYYSPTAAGGPGGRAWAGCTATALAQLLHYWGQPSVVRINHSYTDSAGSCTGTHSISEAGLTAYDWANMPDSITTNSPSAQKLAIAQLMYHAAVAINSDFEGGNTLANLSDASLALPTYFNFSAGNFLNKSDYTNWYDRIAADIGVGHPILYNLQRADGNDGHNVVCDGYQSGNQIHLNLGWSGSWDAWYNIDSVAANGHTWTKHGAVFGIVPGAPATPANDNFTNAAVLSGSGGTVYGTIAAATPEYGEPAHAGFGPYRSIWYKFTPASSGTLTINTAGSRFCSMLAIYTGPAVDSLTEVASSPGDTSPTLYWGTSGRTNDLTGGTTYRIAVAGRFSSDASNTVLNWSFAPATCTVTFDAQGGTPTPSSMTVTNGFTYGTLPTVTRTGYAFGGWWTGANGTGTQVTFDTTVTAVSNHTLYASWAPAPLNDNFANAEILSGYSGTVTNDLTTATYETGEPHQAGSGNHSIWYKFTPATSGKFTVDTHGSAFDTVLAIYTGSAVDSLTRVEFNDDDPPGTQSSLTNIALTGGTAYSIAVSSYADIAIATGASVLNWTFLPLTVTFDAQGGTTPVPVSKDVSYGSSYGTLATTTRADFTFAGWWTGINGTGSPVTSSTQVSIATNHTLYANWMNTLVELGTALDATNLTWTTGGSANWFGLMTSIWSHDGVDAAQTFVEDGQTNWIQTTVTGPGTLSLWWEVSSITNRDWLTFYVDGSMSNRISGWHPYEKMSCRLTAGTHTLRWAISRNGASYPAGGVFALMDQLVWAPEFTVTFNAQSGSAPVPSSMTVTNGATYGTLPTTARTNYTFGGWWTGTNGSGSQASSTTTVTAASNQTLYAKWTGNPSMVTYNPQGGTASFTSNTVNYGSTYGMLPWGSRVGYTLAGWYTGTNGTGSQVFSNTTVTTTSNQTLYAKWTGTTYTVTFNGQGGTTPSPTSKTVTYGSAYGTLPTNSTYAGYTFGGWWTETNGTGSQVTSNTTVATDSDHTLYAHWDLTLAAALDTTNLTWTTGGDSSWFVQNVTNLTHDGVDAAQSGVNGSYQSNWIETTVTGPVVVSFWWNVSSEANCDWLTFYVDGAMSNKISGTTGTWSQVSCALTNGSHTLRWAYSKDGTVSSDSDCAWVDQVVCSTPITATFDPQGGTTPSPATKAVATGISYGTLATTTRTGYTFAGWWTATNGTGSRVSSTTTVASVSNHTLYASWYCLGAAINNTNSTYSTNLIWTTGGDANWFIQTATTYDGVSAAQSGAISNNQTSWIETTIAGRGYLEINWRGSSELNGDYLTLYVDGVEKSGKISGSTWWGLTGASMWPGTHTYRIAYSKNGSGSSGIDCGWVDQVTWMPGFTVTFDSQGGTYQDMASKVVTGGSIYGPLSGVARTGYTFGGWWTATNGAGSLVTSDTIVSLTSDQTLYASWAPTLGTLLAPALDATNLTWEAGGSSNWFMQTVTTHDGVDAAQSGKIADSQTNWIQTTVTGPGTLSFWWNVSSEANCDFLTFYIDGVSNSAICGVGGPWRQVSCVLTNGSHTFKWAYSKDDSSWSIDDCGWVDQVTWTQAYTVWFDPQGGTIPASITVTNGSTYGPLPTTTRTGYIFGGWMTGDLSPVTSNTPVTFNYNHTLYANWTAVVTVTFDAQGGTAPIPATMTVTNGAAYGTLPTTTRAGYTFGGWWTQTNGTGSPVTSDTTVAWAFSHTLYASWFITLGEALDNLSLVWTTGGAANWFGQAVTNHDSADAAQSGVIGDSQTNWMEATVTGPGTLSFWWKTSSEASYDLLTFYINGAAQGSTGGLMASWKQQTFTLSAGSNILRWAYSKNGSGSSGSDCAWVDQVVWTPSSALQDSDGDGIPDAWEQQYFGGITNANPNALASNRINTLLQAYVAGLDPTNSQSALRVAEYSSKVVGWNTVSGRVYSVYWTTNLVKTGFQCLESNIPWTRTSFTNPATVPGGYYKVKVQLQQ